MSFRDFVKEAMQEPFESISKDLKFESISAPNGDFLRLTSSNVEGCGWFITTVDGFIAVDDDLRGELETKYHDAFGADTP